MADAQPERTSATILHEIRRLHRQRESLAWSKAPLSLRKAAEYRFGSWRAAVEAAGIDYKAVSVGHRYTDRELIAWLRDLAQENPAMTLSELETTGRLNTLKGHFGSWQQAVARAGLIDWPRLEHRRWTADQILDRLRELYASGRTADDDQNVYRAARSHFGSLQRPPVRPASRSTFPISGRVTSSSRLCSASSTSMARSRTHC